MGVKVKLKELIDEMDFHSMEHTTLYNKKTGEFVFISDSAFRAAEDAADEADKEKIIDPITGDDDIEIAINVLKNDHDYVELPSQYDIHEYSIMERFCLSLEDNKQQNILLSAIKGRGAFRRFKDKILDLGIEDDWYRFKHEALKEIAIEWCQENGLEYE